MITDDQPDKLPDESTESILEALERFTAALLLLANRPAPATPPVNVAAPAVNVVAKMPAAARGALLVEVTARDGEGRITQLKITPTA